MYIFDFPENIHTPPPTHHHRVSLESLRGWSISKPELLKQSMELNLHFQGRGGGGGGWCVSVGAVQTKNPLCGGRGYGYFVE